MAKRVENDGWEASMKQGCEASGVITVNSEFGASIRVVKKHCSELWPEFGSKYFNLPTEQMPEALQMRTM